MQNRSFFILFVCLFFLTGCQGDYKIPVGYKNQTSAQCYDPVKQGCAIPDSAVPIDQPVPLVEEKEVVQDIIVKQPDPPPPSVPEPKRTQPTKGRPLFKGTAIIQ